MKHKRKHGLLRSLATIICVGAIGGTLAGMVLSDAREIAARRAALSQSAGPQIEFNDPLPLCPINAEPAEPEDSPRQVNVVTADELNIRATPGGRVIGQVRRGDELEILERRPNGWLRISRGFVSSRYVETRKPEVVPAPAPMPCPFPPPLCAPGTQSIFPPFNQR